MVPTGHIIYSFVELLICYQVDEEGNMKLTKKKAIKLFREHWQWLTETGTIWKDEWPEHDFEEDPISGGCFLCEYLDQKEAELGKNEDCDNCPIDWGTSKTCVGDSKSPFMKWIHSQTVPTCKKYAKIVSELPEKTPD